MAAHAIGHMTWRLHAPPSSSEAEPEHAVALARLALADCSLDCFAGCVHAVLIGMVSLVLDASEARQARTGASRRARLVASLHPQVASVGKLESNTEESSTGSQYPPSRVPSTSRACGPLSLRTSRQREMLLAPCCLLPTAGLSFLILTFD